MREGKRKADVRLDVGVWIYVKEMEKYQEETKT